MIGFVERFRVDEGERLRKGEVLAELDAVNRLRWKSGLPLREAVAQGALPRARAVRLASVTTMGGLLRLSLGGSALWAPVRLAMIFGPGASARLTLVIRPAAYPTLERIRRR